MKVLSQKSIITSALMLSLGVFMSVSTAQANPSYAIDAFTIKYYKSLLEARELSKPTESRIEYYTTRTGEEKFAGYKYGKLDDSFAYENRVSRGVYRGAKGEKRSTAMTNYHTPSLTDNTLLAFRTRPEEVVTEAPAPEASLMRASALKKPAAKKVTTPKQSTGLLNIMMGHNQVFKKGQ